MSESLLCACVCKNNLQI